MLNSGQISATDSFFSQTNEIYRKEVRLIPIFRYYQRKAFKIRQKPQMSAPASIFFAGNSIKLEPRTNSGVHLKADFVENEIMPEFCPANIHFLAN